MLNKFEKFESEKKTVLLKMIPMYSDTSNHVNNMLWKVKLDLYSSNLFNVKSYPQDKWLQTRLLH